MHYTPQRMPHATTARDWIWRCLAAYRTLEPGGTRRMDIHQGDKVLARSAIGEELPRIAISGVVAGHDFEVVWVCKEEEWQAAIRENRQPDALPWPAGDVRLAEPVAAS